MSTFIDYITARRLYIKSTYSELAKVRYDEVLPSLVREIDKVLVYAMYMVGLHKVTNFKAQDMCKFYNGFVHRPDEYYE